MPSQSAVTLVALTLLAFLQAPPLYSGEHLPKICFAQRCFHVEIARTFAERARGLQRRPSLGMEQGMLFIFEESARHGFWMKDTLIPLDMIWMDQDGKVVTVAANVPPCVVEACPSYNPTEKALYVLEINGGLTEEFGIQAGDQAVFRGINK